MKRKSFCQFISAILRSRSNFEHFEIKDDTQSLCISEIRDCQKSG